MGGGGRVPTDKPSQRDYHGPVNTFDVRQRRRAVERRVVTARRDAHGERALVFGTVGEFRDESWRAVTDGERRVLGEVEAERASRGGVDGFPGATPTVEAVHGIRDTVRARADRRAVLRSGRVVDRRLGGCEERERECDGEHHSDGHSDSRTRSSSESSSSEDSVSRAGALALLGPS